MKGTRDKILLGEAGTPRQSFKKCPKQKPEMPGDRSGCSFFIIPYLEALWVDMTDPENENLDMSQVSQLD